MNSSKTQTSLTFRFDLPASFDPTEFLSGSLALQADCARWLVSTVIRKTAGRDLDIWGCVRLDSQILSRVMGNRASGIIRALAQGGAIEVASYRAGVRCKGYRLASRYLGDRCVRVPCVDPRLRDRLQRERERMQAVAEEARSRWLPIHHALDKEQRYLTITADADGILDALPEHTRLCQDVLVHRLRRRELPFSVSSTGRAFNSVTGLKRELRAALRIDGERLAGVDIANAQPALLAMIIGLKTHPNGVKVCETYKHTGAAPPPCSLLPPLPLPPLPSCLAACLPARSDVADFVSAAASGLLYKRLLGDCPFLDRATVKKRFLVDVLAKRGRYPSDVERAFRKSFPSVYRFIRTINRDDHGTAIRMLQRLESWLVVETVAPKLLGRVPLVSLHDAIYSSQTKLAVVEQAFESVFDAIGFRLALKREGEHDD